MVGLSIELAMIITRQGEWNVVRISLLCRDYYRYCLAGAIASHSYCNDGIYTLGPMLHRLDGPAVDRAGYQREWWQWGVRHRTNGPAVETPNIIQYFYYHGKEPEIYSSEAYENHFDIYCEWICRGKTHRSDGPAYYSRFGGDGVDPTSYRFGYEIWYRDGKRHRSDGPAIIHHDESIHREIADPDRESNWWFDGEPVHRWNPVAQKNHRRWDQYLDYF